MNSKNLTLCAPIFLLAFALAIILTQQPAKGESENPKEKKVLRALMVTGGCCHDYEMQKDILSAGISERIDTEWEIFYEMDQEKSKAYLSRDGWSDGFDFVLYNHCFANEKDAKFIDSIAAIHANGLPLIALHCAMHSYHWKIEATDGEEKTWPKLLGAVSRGHGPKQQIKVSKVEKEKNHPILADLPDDWTTPEGELYGINKILDSTTVLAFGENGAVKEPQAVIWTNTFGKARVFCTTIGHHNSTMATKEYLDLIANGVKWVMAKD